MLRRLTLTTGAAVLVSASPALAAGSVSMTDNGLVTVDVSGSTTNQVVRVMRWALEGPSKGDLVIEADAAAGANCGPFAPDTRYLTCAGGTAPQQVAVLLGPGDDVATGRAAGDANLRDTTLKLRLAGGGGDDALVGGPNDDVIDGAGGFDTVYAGEGDDNIKAKDGNPERVDCGEGIDVVDRDDFDTVSDCDGPFETDTHDASLQGDLDHDGVTAPADCNDADPNIHPGAADVPDNGVDENCDGVDATNRDRDGDGVAVPQDCDDSNPAIHPGVREVYGNAVDEDCSGRADPLQAIEAGVQSSFLSGKTTTVRRLRVASALVGTVARVSCIKGGKKCPLKAPRDLTVTSSKGTLDLRSALKLRKVKAGVVLEVRLLREGSIDRLTRFTFKKKKLPKSVTQCQRPGEARPSACP